MKLKQIHIAWIGFQRRQVSMQSFFGFEAYFFPVERKINKLRKAYIYAKTAWKTFTLLKEQRPDVVWVQLPQTPLLWVCLLFRLFIAKDMKIVADCHNAMFRAPWNTLPFTKSVLNACNAVVVHNDSVLTQATHEGGIKHEKLIVVEDPPANFDGVESYACSLPRPWVVFPASFAADEPVEELMSAARLVPDVTILVTGNTKNIKDKSWLDAKPSNMHFLGFLSISDFDSLIMSSDAVLALTRFDGIQLSVCGEAVGAAKPLIVSDTSLLRRIYPDGTIFVLPNAKELALGMREALLNRYDLTSEMQVFKEKTIRNYREQRVTSLYSMLNISHFVNLPTEYQK